MAFDRSILRQYAAQPQMLRDVVAGLTPEQLRAFPVPGTWSIQQIALHLADSDLVLADRMKRVIAEDGPTLLAYDESAWAARLDYHQQDVSDAVALLEISRRSMSRVLERLGDADFERHGIHNVAGRQTLADLVAMAVNHFEHHLKFARDKRAKVLDASNRNNERRI
jgi:uncharacterized damage-inducible protein DinB